MEREDKKIFLFLGAGAAICDFFTEEQQLPLQKELRPRLLEKVFTNTTIYNQINEYLKHLNLVNYWNRNQIN